MHTRHLAALLLLLLVGCGPTHTAGTKGLAAGDLSVLSIHQLPEETHVEISAVQFDGAGDQYTIGAARDFYLLPGNHTASFTFTAHIPGPLGLLLPKGAVTVPDVKDIPLGTVAAGKAYELAPPTIESFEQLLKEGTLSLSLVREKAK